MNNTREFKLVCTGTNARHTTFNLFDADGANCGRITILTTDTAIFAGRTYQDKLFWEGHVPAPLKEEP